MISLRSEDYRKILNIVFEANSCQNTSELIKAVLPAVADFLHSECVTFQRISMLSGNPRVIESRSFKAVMQNLIEDTYFPNLYKDSYYQYSPLLKAALRSRRNVYKIGNDISYSDWEKSPMYNHFISPQHLYWEMFLAMRGKINLYFITLWHTKMQRDFTQSEIAKADILVPQLALAIDNIRAISMIKSWKEGALSEKGVFGEGLLLLDYKFKPCYFNTKAVEFCSQLIRSRKLKDMDQNDIEIPSIIIDDCTNIMGTFKMTGDPVACPRERIVFGENGERFHIEYSLIWKADENNFIQPYFTVCLSKPDKKTAVNERDLSKRENDVLYLLVNGLSHGEIAQKLYISELTVHTHVKNIYRKLGIHNKIELLNHIRSPKWLPQK